jgi:hypothetical protein
MQRNFRPQSPPARTRFIPVACWMLAGLVIPLGSSPARAAVEVRGTSASVHVVAHNAKVSEVLRAIADKLESFRCKEATNLDDVITGSYNGPVEDVLGRILRGYDYVITTQGTAINILIVGKSAAAPTIVPAPASAAVTLVPPAFAAPLPIGLPPTPARGR